MAISLIEIDQNAEGLSSADWTPSVAGTTLAELDILSAREREDDYTVRRIAPGRVVTVRGVEPRVIRSGWLIHVLKSFGYLLNLPPNWDSYGALPISRRCVEYAIRILIQVMGNRTPAPSVVPTVSGGVQAEWHINGIDLEIEVSSPTNGQFYFFDHRTENEREGSIPEGLIELKEKLLPKLTG